MSEGDSPKASASGRRIPRRDALRLLAASSTALVLKTKQGQRDLAVPPPALVGQYSVRGPHRWLAIVGDSNAAGGGAGQYEADKTGSITGTFASNNAAGMIIGRELGWGALNFADSGATFDRFERIQWGQLCSAARQHGAPSVIFLSLGGNEWGVSLPTGLFNSLKDGEYNHALNHRFAAGAELVSNGIDRELNLITSTFPETRVLAMGLPNGMGPDVSVGSGLLSATGRRGLRDAVLGINRAIRHGVEMTKDRPNVGYVNLEHALDGHWDISEQPWVKPFALLDFVEHVDEIALRQMHLGNTNYFPYHPSTEGQLAYARVMMPYVITPDLQKLEHEIG